MYRNKKKKNKLEFLVNLLFIILILILLIWLSIQKYEEDRINKIANSASLEGDFVNIKSTEELENENSKNGNSENENKNISSNSSTNIFSNTNANLKLNESTNQNLNQNVNQNTKQNTNQNTTSTDNADNNKYPKEKIIEEYKGYKVEAKLEIPEISLETYVLKEFSSNALNISVTKFWGANANCIGNFCIAGHNFKNSNMFHNLKKLNIGDKIIITDNNIGKVEYQIYQIDIVLPANVDCLDQETNGKRTVTLITCTNDSAKRIIVKAKEIKD